MTTHPPVQEDLFGNPATTIPADTTTQPGAAPLHPRAVVNDMDLAHTVLADITSDTTVPFHIDDHGQVRRCAERATTPVPADVAVVVEQLMTARYLTTRRGDCSGHGVLVTATRDGRNAVHRWRAYRRPSTWGPAPDPTNRGESNQGGRSC